MEVPPQALIDVGFEPDEAKNATIFKGQGCTTCNNTGYKGRLGLYEVLECTDEIRQMILEGASAMEIKKAGDRGRQCSRSGGADSRRLRTARRPSTRSFARP